MWIKNINRRELLDILLTDRAVERADTFQTISLFDSGVDEIQIIWNENPMNQRRLPETIIVPHNQKTDLLAWALTYVNNFRPFTAFFRLLDRENINKYFPDRRPTLNKLENACLGLILMEAAVYLDTHDIRKLSPGSCYRTYSFVMSRAIAFDLFDTEKDPITDEWLLARQLTGQSPLNLSIEHLRAPWAVILELSKQAAVPQNTPLSKIIEACQEILYKGDISKPTWYNFVDIFPELRETLSFESETRETRVMLIERAFGTLPFLKIRDEITCAFMFGFLTSQIAPGTIDHINLLVPYLKELPSVLLWYGLCAGLQKNSTIKNYAGGLGHRVARNLLQSDSVFNRPRCDIALPELEILLSKRESPLELRADKLGQLEIEIAPCITTTVKWPPPSVVQPDLIQQDEGIAEMADLEAEVTLMVTRLENVRRTLSRLNKGVKGKNIDSGYKGWKSKKSGGTRGKK